LGVGKVHSLQDKKQCDYQKKSEQCGVAFIILVNYPLQIFSFKIQPCSLSSSFGTFIAAY